MQVGAWRRLLLVVAVAGVALKPAAGQISVTGSLRTRVEAWDWFAGNGNNDYAYSGSILRVSLRETRRTFDWQLELAAPLILGLPDNAIGPGGQGQMGFGASYYTANGRITNAAMVFPKQGFIRFDELGGHSGQSLKAGRMEFIDGTEVAPKDAAIAAVKRERIAHRLLGNVGFSHVGRSFDGVEYARNGSALNLTLFAVRPTRGVYQVDGWGELNANVFYAALTGSRAHADWRIFGLGYSDYRDGVVKTDNRAVAARTADTGHINIGTFGGHYLQTAATSAGNVDFLFWGAVQTGSWGNLAQRSSAVAVEAGWQPAVAPAVRPWVRIGYDRGSGDGNPNDGTHGTFFPVLPTPRIYARFPFFNLMNSRDAFVELVLRPTKSLAIRSDLHSVAVANRNDLWYSGGGMYQPWTFGYTGRPSNGQAGLATMYDASVDYSFDAHVSVGAYLGHAAGKSVVQAIYPKGANGNFGFLELLLRM